jgi:hypothetical protein
MIPLLDITAAPPVVCTHCGREIPGQCLFCVYCAFRRLGDGDIAALVREIRRMPKGRVAKTHAQTDCVLCGKAIPVRSEAYVLARPAYAHQECVRALREKVDELAPRREAPPAEELPFGEDALEIE